MRTPVTEGRGPGLAPDAEPGSPGMSGSLDVELGVPDDDGFALPPPALAQDDDLSGGGQISMLGGSGGGPGLAMLEEGPAEPVPLSALAMAAHLQSLQLVPSSAGDTRCPSPELTALATEATEGTEYQDDVFEAVCAQRHRRGTGAFPPCGAAVRVGRRRVAARAPRQIGLATRRAAPGCGMPLRAGASQRRQPQRGAAQ